jgi:hypothetical protein
MRLKLPFIVNYESIHRVSAARHRLTVTSDEILNLPRKSRHLDLTREEVSDAESRAEEN